MADDRWNAAIKEALVTAPSAEWILDTLEFRQVGVQNSVRLVSADFLINATDEDGNSVDFEASNFAFTLPAINPDGSQVLNFTVHNIGRRASDFIEAATAEIVPVNVIYRPYMHDDFSAPAMSPVLKMTLVDVQIDAITVSGGATFTDLQNMKFPSRLYNRADFPGIK